VQVATEQATLYYALPAPDSVNDYLIITKDGTLIGRLPHVWGALWPNSVLM